MYLAKTCAKEAPSVALKLVMAAKATPLDASWPHLKELTTSILETNEGHLLAEALFQALDGASSASPDTQKAMVEWMTSNILKGTQSLLCKRTISLLWGNWTTCLSGHLEKDALLGKLFHALLQEQLAS